MLKHALIIILLATAFIVFLVVREALPNAFCADLGAKADLVVVGVVKSVAPQLLQEQDHIVSFITIAVEQTVKGYPTSTRTLREFGGRVGDRVDMIVDAPTWRQGERVLLFLDHIPQTTLFRLNTLSSQLRIKSGAGGDVVLTPQFGEVSLDQCIAYADR